MSTDRDGAHVLVVSEWADRCARGRASEPALDAFEVAFGALWGRARQTLGDPALAAIVERVLYTATEGHPVLSPVTVDARGLSLGALQEGARDRDRDVLLSAFRFVLEEVLTVVGDLTADILTPALHSTLASLVVRPRGTAHDLGAYGIDVGPGGAPGDPRIDELLGRKTHPE